MPVCKPAGDSQTPVTQCGSLRWSTGVAYMKDAISIRQRRETSYQLIAHQQSGPCREAQIGAVLRTGRNQWPLNAIVRMKRDQFVNDRQRQLIQMCECGRPQSRPMRTTAERSSSDMRKNSARVLIRRLSRFASSLSGNTNRRTVSQLRKSIDR